MVWTLGSLAHEIGATLIGDSEHTVSAVAPLHLAKPNELSFLSSVKFKSFLVQTSATAVILKPEDQSAFSGNALVMRDPYLGYAKAATLLYPQEKKECGVHPSAVISKSAQISPQATIGAQVVVLDEAVVEAGVSIASGSVIGKKCHIQEEVCIFPNVTVLDRTVIGKRTILNAGVVIGSEGFGFAKEGSRWVKIPQLGRVILGDDVEIGANVTIDRGALEDTVIADGVKIDNLVQVAHNVQVGKDTAIAAQTGISGSTQIGKRCVFAGQVGVAGHLQISDDAFFTGQAMVTKSVKQPGAYSSGIPALPRAEWQRNAIRFKKLNESVARLKELEQRIQQLEQMIGEKNRNG